MNHTEVRRQEAATAPSAAGDAETELAGTDRQAGSPGRGWAAPAQLRRGFP